MSETAAKPQNPRAWMSPTLLGAAVAFLGGALLVSWYTKSLQVITPNASFVPMQYSTALGFVITGIAFTASGKVVGSRIRHAGHSAAVRSSRRHVTVRHA